MEYCKIHTTLLKWYAQNKRDLPWRKNKDAYRIWISEIMLQQTRVEAVIPYYEKFLKKYPSVAALAKANNEELMNLWTGLGYYSRARNLKEAAIQMVSDFGSKLPSSSSDLRSLKGIGPYTAAAISSMAFGAATPAIDGNLERVIARLTALKKNPKKEGFADVENFALKLAEFGNAGDMNQAFMDLSSVFCLPKNPKCSTCPLQKFCKACKTKKTDQIPVKVAKAKAIAMETNGAIIFSPHKNSILLTKRNKNLWLPEMWDIPWWTKMETVHLPNWEIFGSHTLSRSITKYKIQFKLNFYCIPQSSKNLQTILKPIASDLKWLAIHDLHRLNLPNPSKKALHRALQLIGELNNETK